MLNVLKRYWLLCKVDLTLTAKDFVRDLNLGVETIKTQKRIDDSSVFNDAWGYDTPTYWLIDNLLNRLKLTKDDVFVDLGCGKGRVLFLAAQKDIKKAIGVELRKPIFNVLKNNVAQVKYKKSKIEVFHGDAAEAFFPEGTIYFMNNPFGKKTLDRVLSNIKNSLETNPRKIRIVYANSLYSLGDFKDHDWLVNGEVLKLARFKSGSKDVGVVIFENKDIIQKLNQKSSVELAQSELN